MENKLPRTPFSTPLSGSARETENRIRSICSGPKRRPPVLFLAAVFVLCLLCGNLVSCQAVPPEETPALPGSAGQSGMPSDSSRTSYEAPGGEASPAVPVDPDHPPRSEEEEWLLQALYLGLVSDDFALQDPAARLLAARQGDGCILGAACVTDFKGDVLVLGVMDRETHQLTGPIFRAAWDNGTVNLRAFQREGEDLLLYTINGTHQGYTYGEAGLVRFNGKHITWEWPVEGDVRYPQDGVQAVRGAREPYQEYWEVGKGHLALMAPGGVDIFTENAQWGPTEGLPQWELSHNEYFYPCDESALSIPIYFQARRWLEEITWEGNNPMQMDGGSALWRITSLRPNTKRYLPEERLACFTLRGQSEDGSAKIEADLFFSYEDEFFSDGEDKGVGRSYSGLDHAEILSSPAASG